MELRPSNTSLQFPGSKTFQKQIIIHSFTPKKDFSLYKEFQINMSKYYHKHGAVDQGKDSKRPSKRTWTDREYHYHNSADVSHKDLKMYCDTNQFPSLPFCGLYPNPHGARSSSKHYHLRFDTKLGRAIC